MKNNIFKRTISLLLSMVMVFSMIPVMTATAADAVGTGSILKVEADESTLDSWKLAFDPVNITTQHAGGVWTDKSVLKADGLSALGNISGLSIGQNNFLVALSALAANSVIVGQGTVPTDTVFVLDISGSMSTDELRAMVSAANVAIHSLLSGDNNQNRVGIVLYSNEGTTLLELDHYTPVVENNTTEYIELHQEGFLMWSTNYIRAAQATVSGQTQYLKDGQGNDVTTRISTTGATYLQSGLQEAWEVFGRAEAKTGARTPVLVLMSDGAPTYTTNLFSDVANGTVYGTGDSSTPADGFVTQLTAAWVKEQMKKKYNSDAYLYTLGFGVDSVTNSEIAKEVLDPDYSNSDVEGLWTTYNGLTSGDTMEVALGNTNSNNRPVVTFDATVQNKNNYVDRYFSAAQASDLSQAFQQIVNEISLQAGYYVTRVEGENANLGGYITFVDEIGTGMQVKDIKGILLGTDLYTGQQLAQTLYSGALGTKEDPTTLGDNLVWALKERLRVADRDAVHALLDNAFGKGQLAYDSTTGAFSNYIGWFGDANGNYIGFWDAANADAAIPDGAVYANKCYLMMGSTTGEQTNHASDMMYVAIQVSKKIVGGEILDNTPEQVIFRIPAALLPMVTYQITLNGESVAESTSAEVEYKSANPIRLLYEVGVHEKLNPVNIYTFLREGYQAKDAQGNYYLYSNAWYWEPDNGVADYNNPPTADGNLSYVLEDTSKNHITYAYFEPGADNEHYYFTEDKDIYIKDGSNYTKVTSVSQLVAGNTYYYKHYTFTNSGTGINQHYDELSQEALQVAIGRGLTYVPKGTMHFYNHSHDRNKSNNDLTKSFFAVRHHLVDASIDGSGNTTHSYELIYMGNNGRITYQPSQGIQIEKRMADGSTPGDAFTFDVALSNTEITSYRTLHVAADGTETEGTVRATGGNLSVSMKPGESVYILDIPATTTYTVTERRSEKYLLDSSSINASGTVTANSFQNVVFTNRVRGVGSLNVTKTVTYENGAVKNTAAESKKFSVTVKFNEGDVLLTGSVYVDGVPTNLVNGTVSFEIVDGQTVAITGIPEGYEYTVTEATPTLPGYSYVGGLHLTGKIETETHTAVLHNKYTPAQVEVGIDAQLSVNIYKTLLGENNTELAAWNANHVFSFELQKFDPAVNDWVNTGITISNIDAKGETSGVNLSGEFYTTADTYLYRVSEVPGNVKGMTYDTTDHDFRVYVTDSDLDGKLEISKVEVIDILETALEKDDPANKEWVVGASFTNTYIMKSTSWTPSTAKKYLNGREMLDGEFEFELYLEGQATPLATVSCGKLGDIHFPARTYTTAGTYTYIVKEKVGNLPGVTYDLSEYKIVVVVKEDHNEGNGQLVVTSVTRTKIKDAQGNPVNIAVEKTEFTNTYKAAATDEVVLEGNKVFTGHPTGIAGENFQFTLTGNGQNQTKELNTSGTFRFDALTFDTVGTYIYTIQETLGSLRGVTYDRSEYRAIVTVTDDGTGKLKASVAYEKKHEDHYAPVSGAEFVNTYKAAPTTQVVISGEKVFTDITAGGSKALTPANGAFSFTLSGNGVNETVTNVGKNFAFSGLTYDQVGTYTYTVTEVNGGQKIDGISYDGATFTVTVTVTDPGNGQLAAQTTITKAGTTKDKIEFTNTYAAKEVKLNIIGRKLLSGRPEAIRDQEFSFTLTGEGVNETVANDANGMILFPELTYTTPGVHHYTIQEVNGGQTINGVKHDGNILNVTVTVTDNGKGQLVTTVEIPNQDVADVHFRFFNHYQPGALQNVVLGGTKVLKDRPVGLKNQEFSFVLKDAEGNELETVKNDAAGKFAFSGLTYEHTGVYTYTISEVDGGQTIKGVKYDASVYTVTITVTDNNDGTMSASVVYKKGNTVVDADDVVFTNTYKAAATDEVVLGGSKVLTGRPVALKDGEFSFILKDANGNEVETVDNVNGKFTFSGMIFDEAKTYTYTISEVGGGQTNKGVTYDAAVYTVTITVTDNSDGTMSTAVVYKKGNTVVEADDVVFTNTYDAADTEAVVIVGGKVLSGRPEALKDNEFSFTLTGHGVNETVKNVDGKFTFTGLVFDTAGTYTYTIKEVNGGETIKGVKHDASVYTVTVTVTDNSDGTMSTSVVYKKGNTVVDADDVIFTNTYKAAATDEVVLGGSKVLTGRPEALKDNEFSFTLTGHGVNETVKNVGGKFTFTGLTFDTAGTYTYTITEVNGGSVLSGIHYDATVYTVTITVTDNSDGTMSTSVVYKKGNTVVDADDVVFTNTYDAADADSVVLAGTKELADITGGGKLMLTPKDGDFSFVLKDASGKEVETVKNVGGKFTFTGLTFDTAGTYKYTITEVKGAIAGITYDEAVYRVTITVTDNGTGKLVTKVTYEDGEVIFRNSFKNGDAKLDLGGKKFLTGGRPLQAGEFSFLLKDASGKVIETVTNGASGSFAFQTLTFDTVGTYTYTISEAAGNISGVTYDNTVYEILVTVSYDGSAMTAVATVKGKQVESYDFTNVFTPDEVKVTVGAEKQLTNRTESPMGLGGFHFLLTTEGKELTAISSSDGTITFQLTYGLADVGKTYTYKLSEVKGVVEGMIYDTTVYEIKVTVTQDAATGQLKTEVVKDEKLVFTNIYGTEKEPEKPDEPPKTADNFGLVRWSSMLALSAVSMLAVLVIGKKKFAE